MNQALTLYLVDTLRKVTLYAKVLPFLYALSLLISMVVYLFDCETASNLCDLLSYTSPMVILALLILSKLLKLCKWHKLECCLPLLPLIVYGIDTYIYELSAIAATVNILMAICVFILSIFNAYKLFLSNETTH
jgi:hypothetical protein